MIRKNFRASLLVFGMATALLTLATGPAQAVEPALAFHPSKSWSVGPTPFTQAATGRQSCTISNEFNNGFIINITGTDRGIGSLSVDFRQSAFQTGQSQNVTLSVPGIINRSVPGVASRPELLVMDMKDSGDVFDAMKLAGVVDMNVQGSDFRFFLNGFETAADRFSACVTTATATVPPPAVIKSASRDVYELPLESLKPISPGTNQGKTQGKTEQKVAVQVIAPPPPAFEITKIGFDDVDMSRQPRREKPAIAESKTNKPIDLTGLFAPEKTAEKKPPGAAKIDAAQPSKAFPVAVNDLPPGQPRRPRPASWARKAPVQKIAQNTNMKSPPAKIRRNTVKTEADFISLVDKQMAGIKPAAGGAPFSGHNAQDMRTKISELERRVHTLSTENAAMESELKTVVKETEQERISISSENWDLERATMRYNEAERQIDRLGKQLQRERLSCQQETGKLEGMLFDPEVTSQQQLAKLTSLERDLASAKDNLAGQRRTFEERIRLLEQQLRTQ